MKNFSQELDAIKSLGLWREQVVLESPDGARIRIDGRDYINFSSNNYLGLAQHPRVVAAAAAAAERWGAGAGASRLLVGTVALHRMLEDAIARLKKTEAALVFPTGFQAALGAIQALVGKEDRVVLEKEVHACLVDGARLSGASLKIFRRHDPGTLESVLKKKHSGRTLVVVDGIYSMDGDILDLPAIHALCKAHEALLLVDDAHATGVIGPHGEGTAAHFGISDPDLIQMGTLSKALGAQGGFIAARRAVIDLLVNRSRAFIYTTGLAPSSAGAALEALVLLDEEPQRRERLCRLAAFFRSRLREETIPHLSGESPIIPVIAGGNTKALEWAQKMRGDGVWVHAIRPPTVPDETARLRLSVTAEHTEDEIERCVNGLVSLIRT